MALTKQTKNPSVASPSDRNVVFFSLFFSFSFWKLKNLFFSQEMALAMFVIFFAFPVVVVVVVVVST